MRRREAGRKACGRSASAQDPGADSGPARGLAGAILREKTPFAEWSYLRPLPEIQPALAERVRRCSSLRCDEPERGCSQADGFADPGARSEARLNLYAPDRVEFGHGGGVCAVNSRRPEAPLWTEEG